MKQVSPHSFHIPVMGLGYTIDTPLKVGRFGISSTVSIIEDDLIEQIRQFYSMKYGYPYEPVLRTENDFRARRITAYLNLMDLVLKKQILDLKDQPFGANSDLDKYFTMLEDNSFSKLLYTVILQTPPGRAKKALEMELRKRVLPGNIDVNIMTKCDRQPVGANGESAPYFSDALSALRGFAQSNLESSVVFSAGLNPRLYSYCESFSDFYPLDGGSPKKQIVIKVSDFRSALVQGKFLARKGLWVSEFRIESGLNCGGHAFPTEGLLLGPILEEFKNKKEELVTELFSLCNAALAAKGKATYHRSPSLRITVQGGIGTATENKFLLDTYQLDGTGWGSPFLLVPEATSVDAETLQSLSTAEPSDFYLSHSSPLGVPFNNFRKSTSEKQRLKRIEKKRPGSPCYKKFLAFNTEYTGESICVASRQYQDLKIRQLMRSGLPEEALKEKIDEVTEKDCLCEGLAAAPLIRYNSLRPKQLKAVTICPGPNLAYFSGIFTLRQMVDHIYGRNDLLNKRPRLNMFINELRLYCDYFRSEISKKEVTAANLRYLTSFKNSLLDGISYYRDLFTRFSETSQQDLEMLNTLENMVIPLLPEHSRQK